MAAALAEKNPVAAILILLGLAGAGFLWFWGFKWLAATMASWKRLAEEFPATDSNEPGDSFLRQSGYIGANSFSRSFNLGLNDKGILVRPYFASRRPILIPWTRIKDVTAHEARVLGVQQNILVTVEWQKYLAFSLPHDALPTVERHVPPERIQRDNLGLLDQIKNRAQNR